MEDSWENYWHLQMEKDHDHNNFLDKFHHDDDDDNDDDDDDNVHGNDNDDEFLRGILLEPSFSSESESDQYHHRSFDLQNDDNNNNNNNSTATVGSVVDHQTAVVKSSDSSNFRVSSQHNNINVNASNNNKKRPRRCSSPRAYILSFDNSTMTPATPEQQPHYPKNNNNNSSNLPSSKRAMAEPRLLARDIANNNININQGGTTKKARSSSQITDHIIAERKRRQELTERFIALSATIPGLSKTDKASILRAAIDYVKQLQERVQELEKLEKKRSVESVILVRKSDVSSCANEDTNSSETSSDDHCGTLPDIEARVMGKEVLIEIHCEKENGIELKIMDQLENLHLFVTGSSVLPFGNSALGITIIAQMGEAYKWTVNDLVKNLRQVLLKSHMTCKSDPY